MSWKENKGEDLKKEALKHGLSTNELYDNNGRLREAALQERLRSAKNTRHARNTWIIALISAIASLFSATAAWIAVWFSMK